MGDEIPRRLCDTLPPVILFFHVSQQPTSSNIKQQSQGVGGRGSQSLRGNSSPLENRHTQDMLLTVNNIIQGSGPSNFKNVITEKRTAYNLRGNFTLSIPKVNTTRYGLKSWHYAAAKYWNMLPRSMAGSKYTLIILYWLYCIAFSSGFWFVLMQIPFLSSYNVVHYLI